ncbi:MAG: radical SAM protein, partial [Desulfarculaceae bacterium]|nr:radical SAM protein [Desulfarculaceae bacterium]
LRNTDSIWLPYQTRRGCPMDCSYCSTGNIEGRRLRKRSIPDITANLALWEKAGIRHFFFADNTFNLPPNYAKSLCRAIIDEKLDIRWRCIIYPKHVDKELADLMADAGCTEVSLGFESASPKVLHALNKKFTPADVEQASAHLAAAGITRMGFLLLGGPGETRDTVEQSLAFADELDLDMLKLTAGIRIYPDTALARQAVKEGIIRPDDTLLWPRFYLSEQLKDWLPARIKEWAGERPGLVV